MASLEKAVREIITSQEAAKRLNTSSRTIRDQIKLGKLPGLKVGREFRLDWTAVERIMMARAESWRDL